MAIEIRKVRTESEANAVFRLRYDVYVEELRRTQRCADHTSRLIAEPLDSCANLLCAYDGQRLVGTVRTNYTRCSPLAEYEHLYEMERAGTAHPHSTSVTTKLVVAPQYRGTVLAYRLAAATYVLALRDGIQFDFVDVYPARVAFFERLGYRIHVPQAVHPEYGQVVVMCLGMRDEAHFRKVKSPFLRYLLDESRAAA
jgi:GNAT superfamily N-acetyltransferase